jgi:hypothetical protein
MDKINLRYKFLPGVVTGSAENKAEFLDLLSKLKINDNEELQAIFGEELISKDLFITYDAADDSMVKSLVVNNASDQLVNAMYDRFNTLITYFPRHRGGTLTVNVEKNISPSVDQSLIDYSQSINEFNRLLPSQDIFIKFESLQFVTDETSVTIKTDDSVEKYYNDGKIAIVGGIDNDSWYNYKSLYGRLTSTNVRLIEPSYYVEIDTISYAEFKNSTGEVGIPFIIDLYNDRVNEGYVKTFIDQIAVIITTGKQESKWPATVIKFESRLQDSSGHYFKFIKFDSSILLEALVDNQIEYLASILANLPQITDKDSVVNYARSQWLQ